jgi:hypothetical protein
VGQPQLRRPGQPCPTKIKQRSNLGVATWVRALSELQQQACRPGSRLCDTVLRLIKHIWHLSEGIQLHEQRRVLCQVLRVPHAGGLCLRCGLPPQLVQLPLEERPLPAFTSTLLT